MDKNNHKNNDHTRDRILDEAERLFAEHGFPSVSVRQITQAAGVNLAAVNYHFGNKQNLYLEVFRARWLPRAAKVRQKIVDQIDQGNGSPEEVIKAMASSFFSGFDEDEVLRHRQLMVRELAKPGQAFELVIEKAMLPMIELLGKSLDQASPGKMNRHDMIFKCWSVFAQVLFFNIIRLPVSKITGRTYDEQLKQDVIEHITNFSLHGLGLGPEETR